ncbi:MAG TPA: UTP--glucose-1-phosphate uridylyltransferase GalU [Acidimicrobiales bacterium]|nr:UTP--glucose-1-phosphate uridylyltransferase GalU [Acidimicrobiales bacterium]
MPRPVTKAVIPAAGLGTRFLPATKASPKEMLPLVDKPAIQYVVEEAVDAGLTDVLMVTGRSKRALEDHFDRTPELEALLEAKGKTDDLAMVRAISDMVQLHYVRQGEPLGLGHAVGVAAQHVGDHSFAVLLGDDIMHPRAGVLPGLIEAHDRHGGSVIALKRVPAADVASYGCAAVEEVDGRVVRLTDIVEKPDPADAPSDLAVMGRYVLTPDIFPIVDKTAPGKGGEIQLTDALKVQADAGALYGWVFEEGRFDTGNKLEYLKAVVELALERDDLGPQFRAWLTEVVGRP